MKISNFQKNLNTIKIFFKQGQKFTFTYSDIDRILREKTRDWNLPTSLSPQKFLDLLLQNTDLKKTTIKFPAREYFLFTWGDISIWTYCLSFTKKLYYTHRTALFIHNLIDDQQNEIYVNFEQRRSSASNNSSSLSQKRIDFAFSKPQRITKNIANFKGYKIYLLNGQNTNMYGVAETYFKQNKVLVTSLERTLIDIIVRPSYTNGIIEILNCYKLAKDRITIENLIRTLNKLAFIYPYHQAIGFLLERSGVYNQREIDRLKNLGLKYDFYLLREMTEMGYSKEWKLFYPKFLD
jgi:predicted transcriptional regulator of viral defense system